MGIEGLVALAFHDGPAIEANQLIDDVRQRVRAAVGRSVNYEVSLIDRDWSYIEQVVAPRLALFLKAKRLHVGACAPVFLSIFRGERLYFVAAEQFFEYFRAMSGLDEESFAARVRVWETTGKPIAGLLAPITH